MIALDQIIKEEFLHLEKVSQKEEGHFFESFRDGDLDYGIVEHNSKDNKQTDFFVICYKKDKEKLLFRTSHMSYGFINRETDTNISFVDNRSVVEECHWGAWQEFERRA